MCITDRVEIRRIGMNGFNDLKKDYSHYNILNNIK